MDSPAPPRAETGRPGRATETYARLRELIVVGRISPGSRIIETEVARRLGVSRTPVRSALQRLQQEGYVSPDGEGKRQNRLIVSPLTAGDARELFDLVGIIEGLGARLASQQRSTVRERVVEDLRTIDGRLLEQFEQAERDPPEVFDLYTRFHRCYLEAGAGPRLLALHDSVKPQASRYRYLYSSALISRIPDSVQEHTEIIRGVEVGDGARAERAVRANWANAASRLGQVIEALGERGSW